MHMTKKSKYLRRGLSALQRELEQGPLADSRYFILVDENTLNCCLPVLIGTLSALENAEFIEVPVGEECKSIEVATQVWQTLMESGADRHTVLLCLGGGCVCDLGGFVAATYMRGMPLVMVPTTLLAMVDAAIGGKCALNMNEVKNVVGTFYQPDVICIEPAFLHTLPDEETLSGYMEMVKTAAVGSPELFHTLLTVETAERRTINEVTKIKQKIVSLDPFDHGIRHILNFGHTFGHAVEMYSHLPHGIAVGVGMTLAMYLSVQKTGLDKEVYTTYKQWVGQKIALPHYSLRDAEAMLQLMHHDKKNQDGKLLCVLLKELGCVMIDVEVNDNEVRDAFLRL